MTEQSSLLVIVALSAVLVWLVIRLVGLQRTQNRVAAQLAVLRKERDAGTGIERALVTMLDQVGVTVSIERRPDGQVDIRGYPRGMDRERGGDLDPRQRN